MRQRARQAFEAKIQRGHVMWEVPVGFVRTSDDRIEKIADRQVHHAVAGVFQKFRELGSARQTMLWYREVPLPLPEVRPGTLGRDILWRLPSEHRIHQMLRNPCYAGALVYGRTAAKTVIVDGRAVEAPVRDASQPAGVPAAVEALEGLHWEHDLARQALALAVEKARYEAQRAQRQYDRVDPDNRLVAGELERRWNETLTQVAEAEARLATLEGQPPTLSEEQHYALLTLSHDLATVWHHPAASEALKKRMLRTVLHEMMIHPTKEPPEHVLHLHWHGGVHTAVQVARNTAGKHGRATDRDVIAGIRELSTVCRDLTIAATLNRLGYRTGTGKTWRAHRLAWGPD